MIMISSDGKQGVNTIISPQSAIISSTKPPWSDMTGLLAGKRFYEKQGEEQHVLQQPRNLEAYIDHAAGALDVCFSQQSASRGSVTARFKLPAWTGSQASQLI